MAEPKPGPEGREGERSRAGSELPWWDTENPEVKPAEDSRLLSLLLWDHTPRPVSCFHTLYHTGGECGNGQNMPMFSGLQGFREAEAVGSRQGWAPRALAESAVDLGARRLISVSQPQATSPGQVTFLSSVSQFPHL